MKERNLRQRCKNMRNKSRVEGQTDAKSWVEGRTDASDNFSWARSHVLMLPGTLSVNLERCCWFESLHVIALYL